MAGVGSGTGWTVGGAGSGVWHHVAKRTADEAPTLVPRSLYKNSCGSRSCNCAAAAKHAFRVLSTA